MNTQQVMKSGHWGAWGKCGFKTLFSPTSVNDSRSWRVVNQNVINGYPKHQSMGENERTLTLSVTLHNQFCDLAMKHNQLLEQSNSDLDEPLVIGHDVLGNFKCRSMSRTYDDTTEDGILIASTYQLTLVEVRE
ncbi:phage tail protein [Vibrio sp. OPT18]|uniref:phage tail protein n=1 Tax=Vibrio sp. OPT18 TaxID=2778641 RepID=UPI00187EF37A|nr:phage tail protein [Vibrio sp. OPT18]MBE8578706.1 phage tail protein [Vibrio sp. OPT18]